MALTTKQEHFCRNIVAGMTNKDAYKDAYNSAASDQVAWNESGKLVAREDIQERLKELRKPLEDLARTTAISNRQKQIDFIQSRIDYCLSIGDEQSTIRYTEMLNKIYALYKENDTDQKTDNTLEKVNSSALKRLLDA